MEPARVGAGLPIGEGTVPPQRAAPGRLDRHDLRAEIGEDLPGEGRGDPAADLDHVDAVEGLRALVILRSDVHTVRVLGERRTPIGFGGQAPGSPDCTLGSVPATNGPPIEALNLP